MNTQRPSKLDPTAVAAHLGMCAAAIAGIAAAPDANAVVVTFSTPITVPATAAGIYINLLTGASGTTPVSGWDFNPYLANIGTQLGFYWCQSPAASCGGVATAATGGTYLNLAPGTTVSAASTFTGAILGTTASSYLSTGTSTMGFRFYNESTSAINYGYMRIATTGSATGFPATVQGWSFENSGGAISVPVPEPSTGLMLSMGALALGATNLRRLRRQRRQQAH